MIKPITNEERKDVTEALWTTVYGNRDYPVDQMVAFALGLAVGSHLPEWVGHRVGTEGLDNALHTKVVMCIAQLQSMGYGEEGPAEEPVN